MSLLSLSATTYMSSNRSFAPTGPWRAGSRGWCGPQPAGRGLGPLTLTGMHNALGKGRGMGLSPLLPPPRKREDKPPQGARQWVVLPFRSGGRCLRRWPLAYLPSKDRFSRPLRFTGVCCWLWRWYCLGGWSSRPLGGVDNGEGEPPEGWGNPGGVPRPLPLCRLSFPLRGQNRPR